MHILELLRSCDRGMAKSAASAVSPRQGGGGPSTPPITICLFGCRCYLRFSAAAACSPLEYYDSFSLWQRSSFFFPSTKQRRRRTITERRRAKDEDVGDSFGIQKRDTHQAQFLDASPPPPPRCARESKRASSGLEIFLYILPSLCAGRNYIASHGRRQQLMMLPSLQPAG
jgi:hypothetical protein